MATIEIALEIGTSFTSIYYSGKGIVLREPTVIAYLGDPSQKKVRAVGFDAVSMLGKNPEKTVVVCPVTEGIISDSEACMALLKEFIKKILPESYIFFPKIKAVMGIPTGLTLEERHMYEEVVLGSGISGVTMVENIILSAVGIDLPVDKTCGGLVVNIGGGATEIAVMSLSGVITGCGLNIGGNMMDEAIMDFAAGKHNVKLGINTVRKVKHEIGSLFNNDISKSEVDGIDTRTKNISKCMLTAGDILEAIKPYYLRIADAVESIINTCPPEIAADLNKTGIYAVGGGAMIMGLEQLFSARLNLRVYVPEDPQYASILGAGKLLGNKTLLNDILMQK